MKPKFVWVDNEVFNWSPLSQGGSLPDRGPRLRAYELWEHAESLISGSTTELHLADAISTLKRCLNQRLKLIEQMYNLKKIVPNYSPKGYLEILEAFSLVRPLMLKKLMSIRNAIEHKDSKPPSKGRCLELLDLIWYFLKSTDSILRRQPDSLEYSLNDTNGHEPLYGYTLDFDLHHKKPLRIWGWFPHEMISSCPKESSTKIQPKTFHTKAEKWSDCLHHKDKRDQDLWIIGNLYPDEKIKILLFQTLLSVP